MNPNLSGKRGWLLPAGLTLLFLLFLAGIAYDNYRVSVQEMGTGELVGMLVISTLLMAVPVGVLCLSVFLAVRGYQQKRQQGHISGRLVTWLYRTPRIGGILIAVFVSLFALDVFSLRGSFWQLAGAFLLHALPAIVIGILLVLAWRREWIGALVFLAAAIFFLLRFAELSLQGLGILLTFSGPMAAIALLFWVNWRWKKDLHPYK